MTTNRKTIAVVFATLEAGGVRKPASYSSDMGWSFALDLWSGLLSDVPADDLITATAGFLRSKDARFWPTPGQLLEHVPGRRSFDDGDATWGEVYGLACSKGRANPPVPARELRGMPPTGLSPEEMRELHIQPDEVRALVRSRGGRPPWSFDEEDEDRDAAIHVGLTAIGGWRGLCLLQEDRVVAARASFRNAYRGELDRRRCNTSTTTSKALLESGKVLSLTDRRKK